MKLRVRVDVPELQRLIRTVEAVKLTFEDTGRGMVVVGARPKLPYEKTRPAHSFLILNVERRKHGVDPVAPSPAEEEHLVDRLGNVCRAAVGKAINTQRGQREMVTKALGRHGGGGAAQMAEFALDRVVGGRTGVRNAKFTRDKKLRKARQTGYTKRLGRFNYVPTEIHGRAVPVPAPWLVETGRLARSIHGMWNLGYRRRAP